MDPDDEFENWANEQNEILTQEGRWIAQRLYENLRTLQAIKKQAGEKIKIRTVDTRLGIGYFIIDPDLDADANLDILGGMLAASSYFYKIDERKVVRPARYNISQIFLSKASSRESDLWWFDQYVEEFEYLWKDGTDWDVQ
jgi:hypothetical protein